MLGTAHFAINVDTNEKVDFNISKVIQGRVLVEGDSGSGKSYFICDIVEKTHGKLQQIIIDPEGEYFTLRNTFDDYLLIGKSTELVKVDIEINVKYAKKLAQRILESGANVILDLSEIPGERVHFVKEFLTAVIDASKNLRHPLLLIVDEGQIFAPEKGHGESESLAAVVNIATRGRKRGIGLIIGTQAIAAFNKDVVRQLKTRIIGNCTLDNDMKRAAADLGFTKERIHELRELGDNHHFFAYGPGIEINGQKPSEIIKIKALPIKTELYNFQDNIPIVLKNPKKIQSLASEFADVAAEVEKEANEKLDYENKIKELQNTIVVLRANSQVKTLVDPYQIQKEREKAFDEGVMKGQLSLKPYLKELETKYLQLKDESLYKIDDVLKKVLKEEYSLEFIQKKYSSLNQKPKLESIIPVPKVMFDQGPHLGTEPLKDIPFTREVLKDATAPKGGADRMLKAVASFYPMTLTRNQICLIAQMKPSSGSTSTYLSELRVKQLIEGDIGSIKATELGLSIAGNVNKVKNTNEDLLNFWISQVGGKTKDILKLLASIYPGELSKEEIREQIQMNDSGSYSTYLSILRSCSLIEDTSSKKLKASSILFPQMIA